MYNKPVNFTNKIIYYNHTTNIYLVPMPALTI